jgi:methionine sulfoxide reductase catalytic subunit
MLIGKPRDVPHSAVTPKKAYLNRRRFLLSGGLASGSAGVSKTLSGSAVTVTGRKLPARKGSFSTAEKPTPFEDITIYNNFYEFGTTKTDPAENAKNFHTAPWTVSIEGAVAKPRVISMPCSKIAPLEERIYRHRCVEGWSIVVPWIGFPLRTLIGFANPTSNAKYSAFESLYDRDRCPSPATQASHFPA